MQAVKEKLHDMNVMRKVKAEAKAEEKADKVSAKARMEIAHEVRLAKVAEAEMDLHVAKAGDKADREIAKRASLDHGKNYNNNNPTDATAAPEGSLMTTNPTNDAFSDPTAADAAGAAAGPTYPASGVAPPNNLL